VKTLGKFLMSSQASKEIFCPLAWIHSFVNLGGEYQLCCTSEEYDNDILNEQGEPFKVTDKVDLKTLMNSKHMNAIRKKMLNGQWPNECRRCLSTEQLGGISRRNIEQKSYEHLNEQLLDQTNEDGSLKEINILSSDYRLGNHCNLQCRMCTPRATKNWIPHWLEVQPKSKYTESDLEYFKKMDWFESDDLIMDVERKSDTIEHLHFGGGEPLLSPKMKNILQTYIDKGRAKDIILTYNTNITRLPAHVLKLWPHFKEVRLLVSIDAYGELNDYIRPPSKWCEVDANLRFLNDNASDLKITQIMLNYNGTSL
jgi:sulfatase maturation enzyme AslB (radical SAM superfamily)